MLRVILLFLFFSYCQAMLVNGVADMILQEIARKMPKDKINLPNIEKNMTGGIKLKGKDGWLGILTSLKRTGNTVIDSDKETTDIQLHVGLSRMEFGFGSYSLSGGSVDLITGHLNGTIKHNSLYMRIILTHPEDTPCEVKVKEVELKEIEDVEVKLTGMGFLNKLYSKMVSWSINKYLEKIKDLLSSEIENVFKSVILKHDICGIARG